ncbi:unnamed protein product, partial [Amoebophrya sp. A120]|eukprot:GSA120T00002471001.1
MSNRAILTWRGAEVHEEDMKILKNPSGWLTDRLITFYFEHLQKIHPQHIFVGAESAFWMRHETDEEDVTAAVEALGLLSEGVRPPADAGDATQERQAVGRKVFFPVNNHEDWERIGGTHWSLLVYDLGRPAQSGTTSEEHPALASWTHYDSGNNLNASAAQKFVGKMDRILGQSLSSSSLAAIEDNVPQQQNGHDCGLYVLSFAEALAGVRDVVAATSEQLGDKRNGAVLPPSTAASKLQAQITSDAVARKRLEILNLIEEYASANNKGF